MTDLYAEIQNTLWSTPTPPALIYLAIGGAQPHHDYPFLPGHKMCILIDPHLEDPIRATATVYTIRKLWDWNATADRMFLYGLINFVMRPQSTTRLIVQTGDIDIRPHYPLDVYPAQELLNRVMFSSTQLTILRDRNGDFIQVEYSPMLRFATERDMLHHEMEERYEILTHYVHRLWRIQSGIEPPREWLRAKDVAARCRRLCVAYNLPHDTTQEGLTSLLTQGLNDFALVTHTPLTMAEIDKLIMGPNDLMREAIKLMMATMG